MTARDILMVARPSRKGGTISHRNFLFKVKAWTEQNKKQSLEHLVGGSHSCIKKYFLVTLSLEHAASWRERDDCGDTHWDTQLLLMGETKQLSYL